MTDTNDSFPVVVNIAKDNAEHRISIEHEEYLKFLPSKDETKKESVQDWSGKNEEDEHENVNNQNTCTGRLLNYILEKKNSPVFQSFFFILAVLTTSLHLIFYELALWNPEAQKKKINFLPCSIQVCYYALSVLMGNILSYIFIGKKGVKDCWNIMALLFVFPSAAVLVLVESLDPFILAAIPASTRAVIFQIRIPLLAFISTIVLKRRQGPIQWMFIFSITLSVIGFSLTSTGDLKTYKNSDFILCLIQVSFTAVGSLISEVTFKYMNYPFCTQMAQSRLFSFMTSLAFLLFYCNVNKCFHLLAFHGWNYRIFLLTFWLMIRDWIQTFTIKLLSALWKALASAVSLCLTYFIQVNFQGKPSSPVLTVFTLIVVIDVIGYSLSRMSVPLTETKKEK